MNDEPYRTMRRIHEDQFEIDEWLVRRLLAEQFPHWAELPVTPVLTSGTEHAIYRLGDGMVMRLPYRAVDDGQLEKLDKPWRVSCEP